MAEEEKKIQTIKTSVPKSWKDVGLNEDVIPFIKTTIAPQLLDTEILYLFIRGRGLGLDPLKHEITCIPYNTEKKDEQGRKTWIRVPAIIIEIAGYRKIINKSNRYIPTGVLLNRDKSDRITSATATCLILAPDKEWHKVEYTVLMSEAVSDSPAWRRRPIGQLMKCAEAALIRYVSQTVDDKIDLGATYEEAETGFIDGEAKRFIENSPSSIIKTLNDWGITDEAICKKLGRPSISNLSNFDLQSLERLCFQKSPNELLNYFAYESPTIYNPNPEPSPREKNQREEEILGGEVVDSQITKDDNENEPTGEIIDGKVEQQTEPVAEPEPISEPPKPQKSAEATKTKHKEPQIIQLIKKLGEKHSLDSGQDVVDLICLKYGLPEIKYDRKTIGENEKFVKAISEYAAKKGVSLE